MFKPIAIIFISIFLVGLLNPLIVCCASDSIDLPELGPGWNEKEPPSGRSFIQLISNNDTYKAQIRVETHPLKKGRNPLPKELLEVSIEKMKKRKMIGKDYSELDEGSASIGGNPAYWKVYTHKKGEMDLFEKQYLTITAGRKAIYFRFVALGKKPSEEGVKAFDDWISRVKE